MLRAKEVALVVVGGTDESKGGVVREDNGVGQEGVVLRHQEILVVADADGVVQMQTHKLTNSTTKAL